MLKKINGPINEPCGTPIDYLTYKLDTGKIPINIYIDLSKAFDTLIHDILLDKMSFYGVSGVAKKLLKSYLTQRQQVVQYNGSNQTA